MRRVVGLLLGAAVLAVAAGALSSMALFALAVGMVLVTVAVGASVALAAHRLAVTRKVPRREAREDQTIDICVEVGGLGRLPLPVRLEVQVDADGWVPLGERGGILHLTVGRRGIYQLTPSRLRLRDALGIFEWSAQVGQPELLHILPAPDLSVPIPPRCGARAMAGDADPDGLQPYVPGTPVGRIHWPALARGAGLQQRRLAAPPTGLPLVLVDTTGAGDPRAVDWTARVAAGVVLRLAQSGGCRVLLPGDHTPTTVTDTGASWRGVHRRLASLGGAGPLALQAGRDPDVHIRADHAPAQALVHQPRPLPPGVDAVTNKQVGL